MKPFGEVYLIRNSVNGKCYVGQTTRTVALRWKEHCLSSRNKPPGILDKAIAKYGPNIFAVELLGVAHDRLALNKLEERFIDSLETLVPSGYNLTKNARAQSGWKQSPDVIEKIRRAHLGVSFSDERRKNISNSLKGRKYGGGHKPKARKLTDSQANDIRNDPRPNMELMVEYGVSNTIISNIKRGFTYRPRLELVA